MERENNQVTQAKTVLVDFTKEVQRVLNTLEETIFQMEYELTHSSSCTVSETHFGKVYAGEYKGSLMLFSNFEFEQYLVAYTGLAELLFQEDPCPVLLAQVTKSFVIALYPCKSDTQKPFITRFVMAFAPIINPSLDSEDWGDTLLHRVTAETVLNEIKREASM